MKLISKNEYHRLVGLMALAERHNKTLVELEAAAREITGEVDDMGHTSDAIYGNTSVDELMKRVDLRILDGG